jgi:NAD(P)-dependent dehydrogenase (short-subunit alcohol dehydrogenase family)
MDISPTLPRAALITGGAKRIGRGVAHALGEAGFALALHCHTSRTEAEQTAGELTDQGIRVVILQADLAREDEVRTLLPRATEALGPIGLLINNASTFERDEWHSVTRESWDAHLEPNLRAPFTLIQDFARLLPEAAEGLVVNLLDERVWSLTPHFVSYTVSKAALWTLTQTMALALAPRIRVNGIGPGPTVPSPRQSQAQFDAQCASVPLRRGSSPAEIGRAVLALLALPSLTGQMLALDGGQHLQWSPQGSIPPLEE